MCEKVVEVGNGNIGNGSKVILSDGSCVGLCMGCAEVYLSYAL